MAFDPLDSLEIFQFVLSSVWEEIGLSFVCFITLIRLRNR